MKYVLSCTFGVIEEVRFNPPEETKTLEKNQLIHYDAVWEDCKKLKTKENKLELQVYIVDVEEKKEAPASTEQRPKNKNFVSVVFVLENTRKEESFPILKFEKKLKEHVKKFYKKSKISYLRTVKTFNPLVSSKKVENETVSIKTKKDWEEVCKIAVENLDLELFISNEK